MKFQRRVSFILFLPLFAISCGVSKPFNRKVDVRNNVFVDSSYSDTYKVLLIKAMDVFSNYAGCLIHELEGKSVYFDRFYREPPQDLQIKEHIVVKIDWTHLFDQVNNETSLIRIKRKHRCYIFKNDYYSSLYDELQSHPWSGYYRHTFFPIYYLIPFSSNVMKDKNKEYVVFDIYKYYYRIVLFKKPTIKNCNKCWVCLVEFESGTPTRMILQGPNSEDIRIALLPF